MLTYLKSKLRLLCQLASLGIIVIAQAQKEVEDSTIYNKPFYDACAQGTLEQVQEFLSKDQSLAIAATPDGETCLHLTAISKNVDVAKLLLEMGADVNHRVTHARGLRMNPLSWHVYSGNDEIVKLLLDNGADINMEFDLNEEKQKATVMDVSLLLMESSPDYFGKTHELLISSGGKRFDELNEI